MASKRDFFGRVPYSDYDFEYRQHHKYYERWFKQNWLIRQIVEADDEYLNELYDMVIKYNLSLESDEDDEPSFPDEI